MGERTNRPNDNIYSVDTSAQSKATAKALEDLLKLVDGRMDRDQFGPAFRQEALNQLSNDRPVVVVTRNVDILLMFGPGHGQQLSLPPSCLSSNEIVWIEPGEATFVNYEVVEAFGPPKGIKMYRHMYKKVDHFQNNNMEEVMLYVHDDSCCERTMEECDKWK